MKSVKAAADTVSRYIAKLMSRLAVEASVPALLSRLSKATPQGGHPKCVEAAGDKNFVKAAANSVSRSIAEMLSHFADEVILPALLSDLSVKAKPASGHLNFDFPVKSHGNSFIPMENRLLEQFEIEIHVVPGAG